MSVVCRFAETCDKKNLLRKSKLYIVLHMIVKLQPSKRIYYIPMYFTQKAFINTIWSLKNLYLNTFAKVCVTKITLLKLFFYKIIYKNKGNIFLTFRCIYLLGEPMYGNRLYFVVTCGSDQFHCGLLFHNHFPAKMLPTWISPAKLLPARFNLPWRTSWAINLKNSMLVNILTCSFLDFYYWTDMDIKLFSIRLV